MNALCTIALAYGAGSLEAPGPFGDADVVVFPEIASGGYARLARGPVTVGEASEHNAVFRGISAAMTGTVVAGVALPERSGTQTNSAMVFTRGRAVHRYDKIHLFRPCNDHRYFRAGNSASVFSFPLRSGGRIRAGVIICFDLRFPELTRLLARGGMQILFVPARWPRRRDDAWHTLLKARAIENQIFVAGCNAADEEGGRSYVFDPMGEEVFSGGGDPAVAFESVRIDLERIARAQELHRNLREAVVLRDLAAGKGRGRLRPGEYRARRS